MNNVIFGSIQSYIDLGLWLTDVDIPLPEPRRTVVDVPGRNGVLDLTYSLSSGITFRNRKIKLEFAMADYQKRWISLFSAIVNQLHGKRFQVTIQPDTGHYWDAFVTVDLARCDRNKGTVQVTLDAFPYKYNASETSYEVVAAYNGKVVNCENAMLDVVPTFQSTGTVTVTYGDVTHQITSGQQLSWKDIVFHEGENEIILTGSGTVTITYREGVL